MQEDIRRISEYWKEVYSSRVKDYRPFEISDDFKRFASLFSVGDSYFYIVNLHNFKLEYISESVSGFTNVEVKNLQLQDLLRMIVPEEINHINLKGKVISDFYVEFLKDERVLSYKNMFTYRMKDDFGKTRTMLYQAIPLSILDNGAPEHVLCIQTDVSHLKVTSTASVSFLHMDGGKSYYNVDISSGKFDLEGYEQNGKDLAKKLSNREKQIIVGFSRGLNAMEIAGELNLSHHTIKTHRKNILKKGNCSNTTELVAKCLSSGIISPNAQNLTSF